MKAKYMACTQEEFIPEANNVTVVIFTRNRKDLALNLISYWAQSGVKLLILDGSDNPWMVDSKVISDKVEYCWEISLRQRCRLASQKIDTKFALILGDDDFIPYVCISRAMSFMKTYSDLDAIVTTPTEFNSKFVKNQNAHFDFYRAYSTDELDAVQRLRKFVLCPMDRHFFGFFRGGFLSKVLKDVSENFDFFTEKEWMIFWPSAFELLCVVKGRSRLNFEYIYLKHSMEDVGIFSLTARTMVNRIHEEVASYDLSWKSIFGSEDHISKFTKGIIGESSNSNFGEMEELVKIFLMSKCNSEATDSAHFDKRPDFGVSRIIKLVSFNSSLYMFSRIPYRLYVSIKMTVREGRRKWSSTRKDLNLFPVYKFIKVHQKAKL